MIRYFGAPTEHGKFDEIFAVSDDDRAVRFNYSSPSWRPLTPSQKLAHKVSKDTSLSQLDEAAVERMFEYIDPPRNFSLEWRVRERWGSWIAVGLLLFPAIPLWFVWEDFLNWTGGYSEAITGVAIITQMFLLFGFRDRLIEGVVRLVVYLDWGRWGKASSGTPTDISIQTGHRTIAPPPECAELKEEASKATSVFGLGHEEADAVVRIANDRILQDLEARNPKAWKLLGLEVTGSPPLESNQHLDDLVDRGRMAGMDPEKLRKAFEGVGPVKLQELSAFGQDLARQDAEQNLRIRMRQHQARMTEGLVAPTNANEQKETSRTSKCWTVYVDDNFHYMNEDERYSYGSFDSLDAAVSACQKIVDDFLTTNPAKTADELFESYVSFGEDPWIKGLPCGSEQPQFSAREYARQRCDELRP